jgi:sec-independent protein translocase protein TatC
MTFLEHLEELRKALLKSVLAILLTSAIALLFSPQLFRLLQIPLQKVLPETSHFITTSPFESYASYFKIAFVFGILAATPLIFYFIWSFIYPGLTREEKKGVVPIALFSSILFVGGSLFGYFIVFPAGFKFVVEILEGTGIVFYPKMSDYLSFSLRLLLAFGIIFELPLVMLILGKIGLVKAASLKRGRKYAIVLIVLVAGILTPGPDVLSQILMAIPLLVLYEGGILLVRIFGRSEKIMEPT